MISAQKFGDEIRITNTCYSLLITHYSLLITHYLLLITHCSPKLFYKLQIVQLHIHPTELTREESEI